MARSLTASLTPDRFLTARVCRITREFQNNMGLERFEIDGRAVGPDEPPFVIAEISNNHLGNKQRLYEMLDAAAATGADAVKIQTYDAGTITLESEKDHFQLKTGPWAGSSLFDLYSRINMPRDWIPDLFAHGRDRGVSLFSSVAHPSDVDFLETIECPAYKIASFELVDLPLIRRVGSTGKPVILSTGLATFSEIEAAVEACRGAGAGGIAVLHCISAYPAPASESNLAAINTLRDRLDVLIGLSDHSLDPVVAVAATALGAQVIEKHFTLNRSDGGPDAAFSLEPNEFRDMVQNVKTAFDALGSREVGIAKPSEAPQRNLRKSLFWTRDLEPGAIVSDSDIVVARPGAGVPPAYLDRLIGAQVSIAVQRHDPVRLEDVVKTPGSHQ